MTTIKLKFIAFLVILSGIGIACSVDSEQDDNYCFRSVYTAATGVSGPSTTKINVPITLSVRYRPLGTCGKFKKFDETASFPKDIKILVDYEGCDCPATDVDATEPYTFTATTAGTYTLNFLRATGTDPISTVITVTAE